MSKKAIILFTVFIDILGIGIVVPVLPFYVKSFGVSDFGITMLFSVFSLFAFISAPFLGLLSDRIGRRPILLTSIASTALGWIIFSLAPNPLFLFLGRIIDGCAAGNMSTAQSYLSDLSKTDKERTANLGVIGAMFGLGFIVGPLLGGVLGSINHTLPFWTVAILATANVVMAYFWLPETHFPEKVKIKISLNPLKPIWKAMSDKNLINNYLAWFLFSFSVSAQQSIFAIYLFRVFGFAEFTTGVVATIMGVVIAINQAFLIKKFWIKRFREPSLELYMFLFFAFGYLVMIFPNLIFLSIGVFLVTIGQGVLRVVMTSQIVLMGKNRRGEVLGVMSSIMSLAMIIGPIVAGTLITFRIQIPFLMSFLLSIVAFFILFVKRKKLEGKDGVTDAPVNFPM